MNDTRSVKGGDQPPVSAHPAFPVIVALWFAALLGIGSLVLPVALIERVAVGTGLSSFVAAAQPPLGVTARIAVALAAAVLGGAAGVFVAGKVRAAHAPRPVNRRAAAMRSAVDDTPRSAKRPISAHEELGEGGLDSDVFEGDELPRAPIAGRRRALAVNDENVRSDFLDFAPLPGQASEAIAEPLDLNGFAQAEDTHGVEGVSVPVDDAVQDLSFGSEALSRPRPFAPPEEDIAMHQPFQSPAIPFVRADDSFDPAKPVEDTRSDPLAERAVSDLGMVELVERFALALDRHKAKAAQVEEAAPLVFPAAANPFSQSGPEPAEAASPSVPAALRPVTFDLGDDDNDEDDSLAAIGFDFGAALRSAPRQFDAPPVAVLDPAETTDAIEADGEDVVEDSYTSLLAMKPSFAAPREPVRIDDGAFSEGEFDVEPVVVFPGQASGSPVASAPGYRAFDKVPTVAVRDSEVAAPPRKPHGPDTERALREALEKLQRLSGAA